jgi:hypothetical protein
VGIILGILVLVLLVTMTIVFVLKRNSLNAKAAGSGTAPPATAAAETPVGFDNALYVTSSDKAEIITEA